MIPNPMSREFGYTQDGKKSVACKDNTGPRKYLVIEFDLKERDQDGKDTNDSDFIRHARTLGKATTQDISASLLWYLSDHAPLVLVVDSAGKSLHGWFHVMGWPVERVRQFMILALALGADSQLYSKCHLVRVPGGCRPDKDDPQKVWFQQVHYFAPEKMTEAGNK